MNPKILDMANKTSNDERQMNISSYIRKTAGVGVFESSGIINKIIVKIVAIITVIVPTLRRVRSDTNPTHIAMSQTEIKITKPIPTPKMIDVII